MDHEIDLARNKSWSIVHSESWGRRKYYFTYLGKYHQLKSVVVQPLLLSLALETAFSQICSHIWPRAIKIKWLQKGKIIIFWRLPMPITSLPANWKVSHSITDLKTSKQKLLHFHTCPCFGTGVPHKHKFQMSPLSLESESHLLWISLKTRVGYNIQKRQRWKKNHLVEIGSKY